jgi:PTH1 family peptidyl-tRNA hydrolase
MLLLVGLGNPGPEHAGNRHNVGFMAVDEIARRHGFGPWRARFQGLVAEGRLGRGRALALKPLTFYNGSGAAAGEAARFYKVPPTDVVAFHDEIDLMPGKLRMKQGGGTAGNNGIRSLSAHLGPEFRRCRLGVGHPGEPELVVTWVLHDFAKADHAWLDPLLDAIGKAAPLLTEGNDAAFASKVALQLQPPRPKKPAPASGAT